jgi:putative hydrolase of the HAD superfamily
MASIRTIFSDVGGVLGTNGWDHAARREAADRFHLDFAQLSERHDLVVTAFETGQLDLDGYLDRVVFYEPRNFSRQDFKAYMFGVSRPFEVSLELFGRLARSRRYLMATLNNESRELNLHRISIFGLKRLFSVFFSSCFLGLKKPDEAIYRLALTLTQCEPQECLFIDDRALNIECARACGMQTIHCQDPARLEAQFREVGLEF